MKSLPKELTDAISERIGLLICSKSSNHKLDQFNITAEIREDNGRCIIDIIPKNSNDAELCMSIGLVVGQVQGASQGFKLQPKRSDPPVFGMAYPFHASLSASSFEDIAIALNQVIKHATFDTHGHDKSELRELGAVEIPKTRNFHK